MRDGDLADRYGVDARVLNQSVKRNIVRVPADFMFQLTAEEAALPGSQSVTFKDRCGAHRKSRPFAFTEQGVAMWSSVLRSPRAVLVNIEIMRVFVRARKMLAPVVVRSLGLQPPRSHRFPRRAAPFFAA
jgi:hypothetical protein